MTARLIRAAAAGVVSGVIHYGEDHAAGSVATRARADLGRLLEDMESSEDREFCLSVVINLARKLETTAGGILEAVRKES